MNNETGEHIGSISHAFNLKEDLAKLRNDYLNKIDSYNRFLKFNVSNFEEVLTFLGDNSKSSILLQEDLLNAKIKSAKFPTKRIIEEIVKIENEIVKIDAILHNL